MIQNHPHSSFVDKAKLGYARADVLSLMVSKEYEKAEEALDKMFTDFKGLPDFPRAVLAIGEQCCKQGISKQEIDPKQAKDLYEIAAKVFDRFINELPNDFLFPEACYWAGYCYFEKLNKYEDSIRCFQKIVDNYPQYKYAWYAQFTIGRCFEQMKNTGAIEKSAAEAKINIAYENLLKKYPDCPAAEYAFDWLSNYADFEKEK